MSRKAEGPYKLTPHFTEGSSLISSRFFPACSAPRRSAPRRVASRRSAPLDTPLNSTPISPLRGLLGKGDKPPPRYCSLISPVVLRRLTTAANSHPRNHLRPVLHPGRPLVFATPSNRQLRYLSGPHSRLSTIVVTFLISSF